MTELSDKYEQQVYLQKSQIDQLQTELKQLKDQLTEVESNLSIVETQGGHVDEVKREYDGKIKHLEHEIT